MQKEIILHKSRERSLERRHPWIFSGAINVVHGAPAAGDTVEVLSADGDWLARASYSPASQIRARVWTFVKDEPVDADFFRCRIEAAATYRRTLGIPACSNAWRLIHGEADGIPGCIIDIYGDCCVCQFLTAGTEANRSLITQALHILPGIHSIYERSDTDARARDGLQPRTGLIEGHEPPQYLHITENGLQFIADPRNGHKTGFYLDQRDNRAALPCCRRNGAEVLNCFCYTGGFGLRALCEGASHVTQLDLSESALKLAQHNAELNKLPTDNITYIRADVFTQLRKFRDMGTTFDVVILDPPKFADTQHQLEHAARGYKDINLLGAKLTRPGGTLITFSCSGAMTPELFAKITGDAARDAKRDARIVRYLTQAPDHPVSLNFPEGRYLTGLELNLT